jgi:hypothetical protein
VQSAEDGRLQLFVKGSNRSGGGHSKINISSLKHPMYLTHSYGWEYIPENKKVSLIMQQ